MTKTEGRIRTIAEVLDEARRRHPPAESLAMTMTYEDFFAPLEKASLQRRRQQEAEYARVENQVVGNCPL